MSRDQLAGVQVQGDCVSEKGLIVGRIVGLEYKGWILDKVGELGEGLIV